MLESVAITQTDADHADAVVRFRIFQDDKEKTSQTLKMVAENGRWVIDDIVSNHGSVLQAVNSENEKTLAAIASLQKEQPEAFVAELFEHIADYSWPWTWWFPTLTARRSMPSIKPPSRRPTIPMKICQ